MGLMSLFGFKKLREELILILDIGSASVGGALVLFSSTAAPHVLYTARREIKLHRKIDFGRFVLSMRDALDLVLGDVQKEGLSHLKFTRRGHSAPDKAYCVLGAPWYASQVRTIKISRDKEFKITQNVLSELIANEINLFEKLESERYLHEGIKNGDVQLVEKEVFHIKLNGYEVKNPYIHSARDIEVLAYFSVVPTDVFRAIEDRVARVFHIEDVQFQSFLLGAYTTMRDIRKEDKDFLFVDISGEITEVSVTTRGALLDSVSFPLGKNFFIRKIAHQLKMSPHEALSLLNLFLIQKGNEDITKKITETLEVLKKEWVENFQKALSSLGGGLHLPTRVFLASDSSFGPWFSNIIEKSGRKEDATLIDLFSVVQVDHTSLVPFVRVGEGARKDPFLLLDTIFANKMHHL